YLRLDRATDLTGKVIRREIDEPRGVGGLVGGECDDRGGVALDLDRQIADHRPDTGVANGEGAVAGGHGASGGHVDGARTKGDVEIGAVKVAAACRVTHGRQVARHVEPRLGDLEMAADLLARQRHAIAEPPGRDTKTDVA